MSASQGAVRYKLLNPTNCGIPIATANPQVVPYVSPYAKKTWSKAARAAASPPIVTCPPNSPTFPSS
jgi:hypothetical protein